jgi:hypothetical protein
MRRSYRYAVNEGKGAVMLSLAFELKPNVSPPVDTAGMSTIQIQPRVFPDERECAMKLAESVANIRDIDALLSEDAALGAELLKAQADLLEAAGYDRSAYLRWVADGEMVKN